MLLKPCLFIYFFLQELTYCQKCYLCCIFSPGTMGLYMSENTGWPLIQWSCVPIHVCLSFWLAAIHIYFQTSWGQPTAYFTAEVHPVQTHIKSSSICFLFTSQRSCLYENRYFLKYIGFQCLLNCLFNYIFILPTACYTSQTCGLALINFRFVYYLSDNCRW